MISLFDSHCDTISALERTGGSLMANDLHVDLRRTKGYRRYVQYYALFTHMERELELTIADPNRRAAVTRKLLEDGHAPACIEARFWKLVAEFSRQMAANAAHVIQCRTADELDTAYAAGKTAAVMVVEGAEQLEHIPVDTVYRLGIRAVTLTWNYKNWVGGSNLTGGGLTEAGRQFVQDLQARGILVDLSHGGEELFWDVYKITRAPLIASHSNARALCYHPRNLTDEQFRAICRTGGLAGYNFCRGFTTKASAFTPEDAADHIEHFLSLGGAKHIGMGGDLDGIGELPEGMAGVQDVGRLADVLARRRIAPGVIEDIFFGNQYRLAKECWK